MHGFDFSKTVPSLYQDWTVKILDSVPAAALFGCQFRSPLLK